MVALKESVPMQGHCIFKPTILIFDSSVRPTSHADNDGKVLVCMECAILVLGGESTCVGRALAGGERISPALFALWHPSSHHMYGRMSSCSAAFLLASQQDWYHGNGCFVHASRASLRFTPDSRRK
jgi:hypothetical protein